MRVLLRRSFLALVLIANPLATLTAGGPLQAAGDGQDISAAPCKHMREGQQDVHGRNSVGPASTPAQDCPCCKVVSLGGGAPGCDCDNAAHAYLITVDVSSSIAKPPEWKAAAGKTGLADCPRAPLLHPPQLVPLA